MKGRKEGQGKRVTIVKPIRPTIVEFQDDKEMDQFLRQVTSPKKPQGKVNNLMKKHIEQRKK